MTISSDVVEVNSFKYLRFFVENKNKEFYEKAKHLIVYSSIK